MRRSRMALFQSFLALLLCFSMLVGTTFAWFTDGVSSGNNTIAAGSLDIEMEYLDADGVWQKVDESTEVLDKDALWEPGHTEVAYLKISNAGNLALKYALGIQNNGERGSVNAAGESFLLSDHIRFGVISSETQQTYADRMQARNALTDVKFIKEGTGSSGVLYPQNSGENQPSETYITMVVFMPEEVGNAANYATGQQPPEIQLGIQLVATQAEYEADAFGTDYDAAADLPGFNFPENTFGGSVSADVKNENNQVAENVTIQGSNTNAVIPAGVQLEDGAEKLTLQVSTLDNSEANISLGKNDELRPLNVHVEGVSADNTVPMEIYLKEAAAKGLNAGNLKLYHVENGATVEMYLVNTFTAHNQFKYDPATGDITLYLATFSEVAVVVDTENLWNGTIAANFAGGSGKAEDPYIIANADQLAYMNQQISYGSGNEAHYKLIADVNIGGKENYSKNGVIWYPIGYTKDGSATARNGLDAIFFEPISAAKPGSKDGDVAAAAGENSWYTYGGSFRGVFDGNNHKVTGIYQNTWAMKGNYDGHYYNDAMGLFGYVNGGTVKNLTIDNFYSEGEFAPTGCVTAYAGGNATFENIAITNSHPQTYNTGVAGIVGWDNGNSSDFTFKNITVDSSNTVSALWGSWDVAAAGILGCLKEGSKADFENCHVSATIDVYNDVCGNYQYYWYRYCGAFIGTVYKRLDNGQGALDLSDVTAKNCTVNFGNRHEYYYCEFEKNTQASYTEDYQFSRVPHSELNMNDDPVTCKHNHTLNEDKQAVYIPFYQLFGGYGWGVQGLDLDAYKSLDIAADKKGIEKDETEKSVQKFAARVADYSPYLTETSVTIGELFNAVNNVHPAIDEDNVQVTISPVGETSTAGGTYTANITDWTKGTLFFIGEGDAEIIITDYHYCEPTSLKVSVRKPAVKFNAIVDVNTVIETGTTKTIDEMFAAVEGADVKNDKINVSVETVEGNASGCYIANIEDWTQGTVEFSGEGIVKLGITDDNFCETTYTKVTVKAPVDKFERDNNAPAYIEKDSTVTIGELFSEVSGVEPAIVADSIEVKVTAADGSDVTGTYVPDAADWEMGKLTFSGEGVAKITITDNHFCNIASADVTITAPVKKFTVNEGVADTYEAGTATVTIGELFTAVAEVCPELVVSNIQVTVSPVDEESNAGGEYTPDTTDWTKGTLSFTGKGAAVISITDGYICEATTLNITVTERQPVEKFDLVFKNTEKYVYRVGNQNTVALSTLFAAKENVQIGTVNAVVETISGSATGTYAENTDWTKGTIQFDGTGMVKVTITDNDYCKSTELYLEVVDAVNAISAASATKNNVVLLNDVGLNTIEVSGGYTLYGNGFKMTATNDVMYDAMGVGFVTLKNGTLDNVQIICPNFSYAIIYSSQIKDSGNTAEPSDSSNDARGNVRSAVMADGNSYILDSYVHGGRAAIFLRSGNLVVDNSTISGGAAANIHTVSAQSLTLRDATLIQKPFLANVNDTSKTIMGFSGLFECDESGNSTPLILEGKLVQNAWINESYKQYAPSAASSIISTALSKTEYMHDLDGNGTTESLNLGFTYIPQSTGGSTNANVTDNRTNKNAIPYEAVDVGNALASAKVYSYKNTVGTEPDFSKEDEYTPTTQGSVAPSLTFTDTNADRVFETKFDTSDNRWESTLTVNLDNGNYTFSFDKLLAQRNGEDLDYTVKTADGTAVDTSKTIALTASGFTTYEITVTPKTRSAELITCYFNLVATKTSIPEPEVADTTGGTPLLVVKSKNSDWSCAIPALDGIKIKYYTSANNAVTLDLATLTPSSTGKQNGANNYWEYTDSATGYKLKVTCGYIHDTKQIYGMPVVVNNGGNKMYFTISSTNGYVSTSTSGRTVTLTYEFTDPNGKTLTFSKTWQFNYADYKNGTQYSYSDFVNGTLKEASSGGCVTPDTTIILADGTQKRVDELTFEDKLLVWDFFDGTYAERDIALLVDHGEAIYKVANLVFSDDSVLRLIAEHGVFDYDLNEFVYITVDNMHEYVGHRFVKYSKDGNYDIVTLNKAFETEEVTSAYSITSAGTSNAFASGMLTVAPPEDFYNWIEMDGKLHYDVEQFNADVEQYGLYTYDVFADYVTYDQFVDWNGAYLKIAVEKGYFTFDYILELIELYKGWMPNN